MEKTTFKISPIIMFTVRDGKRVLQNNKIVIVEVTFRAVSYHMDNLVKPFLFLFFFFCFILGFFAFIVDHRELGISGKVRGNPYWGLSVVEE